MANILFIDDDLGSRVLYGKVCTFLGHQSLLADTGKLGLVLARERHPNLIVLDLSLPDIDGLQVLTLLRQDAATDQIPVVIVSAGVSEQDPEVALAAGAISYLTKPVGINALQDAIDHFAA